MIGVCDCCEPILYVRDPEIIKEVLTQTGQNRDFECYGLEIGGIGRIVRDENLLRSKGESWKKHKEALAKPIAMTVSYFVDWKSVSHFDSCWHHRQPSIDLTQSPA